MEHSSGKLGQQSRLHFRHRLDQLLPESQIDAFDVTSIGTELTNFILYLVYVSHVGFYNRPHYVL